MRQIVSKIRKIVMAISVKLSVLVIVKLKPGIQLSYDNRNPVDGTGAQLQRILGIYCLSKFLNLDYVHSGIKDVSTHALDPFQDEYSRKQFVGRVNKIFDLGSSSTSQHPKSVFVNKLRLRRLLIDSFTTRFNRKQILLYVVEPFGIIDFVPKVYEQIPHIDFGFDESVTSKFGQIAIHYRHGVGGFAKYHNQKVSRQLQDSYYLDCIELLKLEVDWNKKFLLFTDAPVEALDYSPPANQVKNWAGSPNFDGEKIQISKSQVGSIFLNSELDIEYIHGGDPLEALAIMANSKILVIGRSSFSYVGGLLNRNGKVIYPRSFWHSPLRGWTSING
jgi:hypothetical protein